MQLARNIPHGYCDLIGLAPQLDNLSMSQRQLIRRQRFQAVQAKGQQGELLGKTVVEFACYPAAFLFLAVDEPAGKVANAIVILIEFFLAFQKTSFRLLTLFKEDRDKHDGQGELGEEQLQKMHVVRDQKEKWTFMPRDTEDQEHCCQEEPA